MTHTPEFSEPRPSGEPERRELAACYARLFLGSDDGKRVLADLRKHFSATRAAFQLGPNGRFDTIAAAVIDGQRQVLIHIECTLNMGAPGVKPNT